MPADAPCTLPPVACDLLATIPADRKSQFDAIEFRGGTGGGTHGYCAEEALAFLAGDPRITDAPSCACPVIRRGTIAVNDSWVWESDAERTAALKDVVLAQLGSRSTPDVEAARRLLAVRFAVNVAAPFWLRRTKNAELIAEAEKMEKFVVTAHNYPLARKVAQEARQRAAADAAAYAADAAADAAAYAADAAAAAYDARKTLRADAKAMVVRYVTVLRAMCGVTPESAAVLIAEGKPNAR